MLDNLLLSNTIDLQKCTISETTNQSQEWPHVCAAKCGNGGETTVHPLSSVAMPTIALAFMTGLADEEKL